MAVVWHVPGTVPGNGQDTIPTQDAKNPDSCTTKIQITKTTIISGNETTTNITINKTTTSNQKTTKNNQNSNQDSSKSNVWSTYFDDPPIMPKSDPQFKEDELNRELDQKLSIQ